MSIKSAKGKSLIITGFISIALLFVIYSRFQNSELLTPDAIDTLQRLANMFYILLLLSFGAIAYGMYLYHKQKAQSNTKNGQRRGGLLEVIAVLTYNPKSRKIFIITFIGYGIFFSLSSGTLVYQPEVSFSYHYGAQIPSWFIAPCCDNPGYMPAIFVYITDHVGLQVIPINFVLQVMVSYLVGLNMALAVTVISISKKSGSITAIGATTGLFIACPTCAGTFLSLFIGTASSLAAVIVISQLQTMFIAITIPVLLCTPFIIAKKLRGSEVLGGGDNSCKINPAD